MYTLFIRELKVETMTGCEAWERQLKQLVCIDIELNYAVSTAVAADNVQQTIDYRLVAEKVMAWVEQQHFQLLETLAEALAGLLLTDFPCQTVTLKLSKPGALAHAKEVGIVIKRSKT